MPRPDGEEWRGCFYDLAAMRLYSFNGATCASVRRQPNRHGNCKDIALLVHACFIRLFVCRSANLRTRYGDIKYKDVENLTKTWIDVTQCYRYRKNIGKTPFEKRCVTTNEVNIVSIQIHVEYKVANIIVETSVFGHCVLVGRTKLATLNG